MLNYSCKNKFTVLSSLLTLPQTQKREVPSPVFRGKMDFFLFFFNYRTRCYITDKTNSCLIKLDKILSKK